MEVAAELEVGGSWRKLEVVGSPSEELSLALLVGWLLLGHDDEAAPALDNPRSSGRR